MEENPEKTYLENEITEFVRQRDNNSFSDLVNETTQEYLRNRKQRQRIYYISYVITSVAAVFLLVVILLRPFQQVRIHKYLARVKEKTMIPVWDIEKNVRGDMVAIPGKTYKEVRFIDDKVLEKHYFVRNGIIYLSWKDKAQLLFRRVNKEGQLEYFYISPSGPVYKMDFTRENKILEFVEIKNSTEFKLLLSLPQNP